MRPRRSDDVSESNRKTALEESVAAATGDEDLGLGGSGPAPVSLADLAGDQAATLPQPATLPEAAAASVSVPAGELEEEIVAVLQSIYDPEIPVNIHELGLIYDIDIKEGGAVEIQMTLTAPGCPVAGPMVAEVEFKVAELPGVATCHAELVWDPPWTMERMSEAARLQLGMF